MDEIKWISSQRRKLGMTQHQLAKMSGVSQSLIAKLEAGRIDAAYSKVKGIIDVLERQKLSSEPTAKQMMHTGVQSISSRETMQSAAQKLRKLSISQMPVSDDSGIIGSISEQAIIAQFSSRKKAGDILVGEIMEDAFPTTLLSTPLSAIASLLKHHPAVLVVDKGKLIGIITKADLLKTIQ